MGQGFIEVIVRRRHRGRPSRRRVVTVELGDGTRVSIGDRVPAAFLRAVLAAVQNPAARAC